MDSIYDAHQQTTASGKKNLIEYGILPLILVAHYSTYVQLSRFTQGNNT